MFSKNIYIIGNTVVKHLKVGSSRDDDNSAQFYFLSFSV